MVQNMATVSLNNLTKVYPNGCKAVDNVSLDIESSEFFIVLGPSGSGKTTLLRLIAGLEIESSGEILIDDKCVNTIAPCAREVSMVFQNYALFPYLSVFDNIAFPLKMSKVPKEEIYNRVNETATLLKIKPLLDRKPSELSGGQRQRVAIGRALVKRSKVYLFDEPLSNLDVLLRKQMRDELKKLQSQLGITIIYVTHDQMDAEVLADSLCIMNDGKIEQVGLFDEIRKKPKNKFVATFMETCSAINLK